MSTKDQWWTYDFSVAALDACRRQADRIHTVDTVVDTVNQIYAESMDSFGITYLGTLGEWAIGAYLKLPLQKIGRGVGERDYDFKCGGVTIEVKAKNGWGKALFLKNKDQKATFIAFCSVTAPNRVVVYGFTTRETFQKVAVWDSKLKRPAWSLDVERLMPISQLKEIIEVEKAREREPDTPALSVL